MVPFLITTSWFTLLSVLVLILTPIEISRKTLYRFMLSSVIVEFIIALCIYIKGKLITYHCNLGKLDVFGIFTTEDIILVYNINTLYYHVIILLAISVSLVFSKKQENYEFYRIHDFQIIIFTFSKFAFFFIMSSNIIGLVILWQLLSAVSIYIVRNIDYNAFIVDYKFAYFKISMMGDWSFYIAIVIIFFFFDTYDIDTILKNINNLQDYHEIYEDISLSPAMIVSALLSFSFILKAGQLAFFSVFLSYYCRDINSVIHIYYSLIMLSFFYLFFMLEPLIFIFDYVRTLYFYFSLIFIFIASRVSAFNSRFSTMSVCNIILQFCYFLIFISLGLKQESVLLLFFILVNRIYVAIIINIYKDINRKDFFFEKVIYNQEVIFDYERVLIFLAFFTQNIFTLFIILNIELLTMHNLVTLETNNFKKFVDVIALLWIFSSLNFLYIVVVLISIIKLIIILFNKKNQNRN